MATAMDENYNGINDSTSNKPTTTTTTTADDVPDYNEAFPQLCSAGKTDDERRRKLAQHASTMMTKIIEIPPEERVPEKSDGNFRRGPQGASRNPPGANTSGQTIQKICQRIQKETSTNITFMYKNQTLLVTISGRPEQVRLAQVNLLREIQRPVQKSVHVPWDFHRYIIGTKGAKLKQLEQETGTMIKVPSQDSQSSAILVEGAKDNVNLCEQKILQLYHTQMNKGFERLSIPYLYHPWIRHHLLDEVQRQYGVNISLPPVLKQADEISIRGEREPVEQAKAKIMQYYKSLEGKIMTFPLEIPCEQHRFILGKKGAGLKDIFDKTNVVVRIPTQEENLSVIQVMGETDKIGEAITMIYKMANAVTVVQIPAARWMQSQIRGDHNSRLESWRTNHPDVRVTLREDHIALEGPPEEVKQIRSAIQEVLDGLNKRNITCVEVDIEPQYYKQLIGKSQNRLNEIQEQTSCEIKFPYDEGRIVQIMGTKENAEKARQMLVERAQKLSSEHTIETSIDPKHYPQLIGTKGKNLEEIRTKFHNIQITFPEVNGKSDKVVLHGNKEDVEQCSKYLQQKFKDLFNAEIAVPKRLYPMLIGKGGANIQRLREKVPDVRIDMPSIDDTKESTPLRLSGKKTDVEKARKLLEEHIAQLNTSMENSVEQTISIDPKWHSRFFVNKRKLLTDLQQQYGDMLIKIPERTLNSDQVILRGPKETLDQVRKRLEELIDTWENTTTKEMTIPHRHHGYLLAHGGAQIQPIQKDFNVQIKFPPRPSNSKDDQQQQQQESNVDEHQQDIVRITGRSDDIDRAIVALEKVIPMETSFDIPFEGHGSLVGKGGANLQALNKQYPLVQITFPPMNSSQNTISLKGQRDQVEAVQKELQESYDKYQTDRQARSFEVRFSIKPEYRALILGARGKKINSLRQTYDVRIEVTHNTTPSTAIVPTPSATTNQDDETSTSDDQQAIPEDNLVLPSETNSSNALNDIEVVIMGYEDKALACRDEILRLIKEFEAKITMEIEIDRRIHARIIGSSGHKLQQIMADYDVEIKFQANNQSDKVHVIGLDQEKIDACIDHLLVLEEDFLQDLPYRPSSSATQSSNEYTLGQSLSHVQPQQQQQEVPSTKQPKNGKQQAPFQVKNAPWTNGNGNENEHYQQQQTKYSRQRNGHENSPKKATSLAPNRDDLGEYPSFSNGAHPNTEDVGSQVQQTTVKSLPVVWGPQKRNK